MRKNRILAKLFILSLCIGLLSGCTRTTEQTVEKPYHIVCTIFPEYSWIHEIIGENEEQFDLTLLLDNGVDLHSYQPTAEDIAKISTCDLFVYVGGESDSWVEDALSEAENKDMQVINLLEVLGERVKEEELVEGMEAEEEHEHEAETGETAQEQHENENAPEYDEHVWLSLKNVQVLTEAISAEIEQLDSANKGIYETNTSKYIAELEALNQQYEQAVANGSQNTIVFGDRFPFRYLVDDYAMNYYAAFVGCSAETEASFETVVFLADKVDALGLKNIFVLENSDRKIAETIIQNTKQKNQSVLVIDSMQSTTSKDVENGVTYISIMDKNLEVLKKALN